MDELEISEDFSVADIKTREDCQDARLLLTAQIVSIERQLEQYDDGDMPHRNDEWKRRAKGALRWKRVALQAVQDRMGQIGREERRTYQARLERAFMDATAQVAPDAFKSVMDYLHHAEPQLFDA